MVSRTGTRIFLSGVSVRKTEGTGKKKNNLYWNRTAGRTRGSMPEGDGRSRRKGRMHGAREKQKIDGERKRETTKVRVRRVEKKRDEAGYR